MKERLYLFDTTLRDGQQTPGIDFSLEDKLVVIDLLDKLGLDYIEGGYPGANPTDTALFAEKRDTSATFTAFGMTKRRGRSAVERSGPASASRRQGRGRSASSPSPGTIMSRVALGTIERGKSRKHPRSPSTKAVAAGREVLLDCEHFFDGYKANPAYALACAKAAYDAGARWVVLCDTNGGTLPHEVEEIVRAVDQDGARRSHLGIHAHNDTEQAVANSLAAVRAGARQIQGTLNGIGERCGNANLVSIIPTLALKPDFAERFETGIDAGTACRADPCLARLR